MLVLPGTQALSPFKANALLQQVQAAVPAIQAIFTRAVHFVQPKADLDQATLTEFLTSDATPERQILKAMFASPSSANNEVPMNMAIFLLLLVVSGPAGHYVQA